jgi:S1-C subfamily serine protease
MNHSRSLVFATALLCAGSLSLPLRAATEADAVAGRALVKRYADAIVGVELVVTLKLKFGNQERPQEQKIEVNGTVISPSGLTVTSLAEVDPQSMFEAVRAASPGGRGPELVGTEFKEVKLRMADGKEVPARFVLKDQDLDLAFMAPEVAADGAKVEFPSVVKLDEPAEGAVLGTYFYISRASKALQRVPLVRTSEVVGVVEKPRKFYLMTDVMLGTPMFDAKGQVLGITLINFAGGRRANVVLPAGDIAEMAKQATAAQAAPKP